MEDITTNGSGFWIFALLILLFGSNGFGGFGGNANGRYATVEDLNSQANATRVENSIQNVAGLTERKTDAIANGLSTLGYEIANKFSQTNELVMAENQKTRDLIQANKISELEAQVNELKTQQMFCGVPKINPYGYGVYPYNSCGGTNCSNI